MGNATLSLNLQNQVFGQALAKNRKLQQCPHCSNFVRNKNLQQHIDKVHQVIVTQSPEPPVPVAKTVVELVTIKDSELNKKVVTQQSLQKCPYCSSPVRSDRLKGHIEKVHRVIIATQPPIVKPVIEPKPLMRKDPRPLATKQSGTKYSGSTVVDQPTDGSKGWHTFRDQGRFGSHPMFDSMDDESTS